MIALIFRDLRIAVRAGGGFGLSLAFFFIIVIFFPFAIGPDLDLLSKVAPGTLWVGALLACLLSLERIFALDFEDPTNIKIKNGFTKLKHGATGFMLIKREVFKVMRDKYPELKYEADDRIMEQYMIF